MDGAGEAHPATEIRQFISCSSTMKGCSELGCARVGAVQKASLSAMKEERASGIQDRDLGQLRSRDVSDELNHL